jgi:hypothetical protein
MIKSTKHDQIKAQSGSSRGGEAHAAAHAAPDCIFFLAIGPPTG